MGHPGRVGVRFAACHQLPSLTKAERTDLLIEMPRRMSNANGEDRASAEPYHSRGGQEFHGKRYFPRVQYVVQWLKWLHQSFQFFVQQLGCHSREVYF